MLRESWKRPALQQSEAVLLPAMRSERAEPRFSDRYDTATERRTGFVPAWDVPAGGQQTQTTALSTYVRPRGSMAGRSVLKAAGVSLDPYPRRNRLRRGRSTAANGWPRRRQTDSAKRYTI